MEACPEYDPAKEPELDFESITVKHGVKPLQSNAEEGSRWMVGLMIEQTPCDSANIPYTFHVSLQGIVLALPGGLSGEKLELAVKVNGPAMLFGAAREMIRAATGRGPHQAVIIPSTNFLPPALPPSASVVTEGALGQPVTKVAKKAARKKPRG